MDPKTQAQNYGPQPVPPQPNPVRNPLTDQVAGIADALDRIDPEEAYLIDSIGQNVSKRASSDSLADLAYQGMDIAQMRSTVAAAKAAEDAMRFAEQSMNLSDQEFEMAMGELEQEMGGGGQVPGQSDLEMPSHLEMGASAVMSVLDPTNAYAYGAAPFNVSEQRRQEKDQRRMLQFQVDEKRRGERINLLEKKLELADRRRQIASKTYQDLIQQAQERGDKQTASALVWVKEFAESKSESSMDDAVDVLKRQFPKWAPDGVAIARKRKEFRDIKKIEEDAAKEKADQAKSVNDDKIVQDTMAPINARLQPGGMGISEIDAPLLEADIQQAAKDSGIPRWRFGPPVRPYAGQQEQNRIADKPMDAAKLKGQNLANEKLEVEIERLRKSPPKDKAEKAKRIADYGPKIALAKAATDAHYRDTPKPKGMDLSGMKKWLDEGQNLLEAEWKLVAKKRFESEGQYPSFDEWMGQQTKRFGMMPRSIGKPPPQQPRKKGEIRPLQLPPGAARVG